MSGAMSIPFVFFAAFSANPHPRLAFAILAYLGVWVLGIRVIFKNHRLSESHKLELATRRESHAKEMAALEGRVKSLEVQLDTSKIIGLRKGILGEKLQRLEIRIAEIGAVRAAG